MQRLESTMKAAGSARESVEMGRRIAPIGSGGGGGSTDDTEDDPDLRWGSGVTGGNNTTDNTDAPEPANINVTGLRIIAGQLIAGKGAVVEVTRKNVGEQSTNKQTGVYVNGQKVGWIGGLMSGGSTDTGTVAFTVPDADSITIKAGKRTETFDVQPEPASINVSSVSIEPSPLVAGEQATVRVQVQNTGGRSGEFRYNLNVNGQGVGAFSKSVPPGKTVTLAESFTVPDSQQATIQFDGVTRTVSVRQPEPQNSGGSGASGGRTTPRRRSSLPPLRIPSLKGTSVPVRNPALLAGAGFAGLLLLALLI